MSWEPTLEPLKQLERCGLGNSGSSAAHDLSTSSSIVYIQYRIMMWTAVVLSLLCADSTVVAGGAPPVAPSCNASAGIARTSIGAVTIMALANQSQSDCCTNCRETPMCLACENTHPPLPPPPPPPPASPRAAQRGSVAMGRRGEGASFSMSIMAQGTRLTSAVHTRWNPYMTTPGAFDHGVPSLDLQTHPHHRHATRNSSSSCCSPPPFVLAPVRGC